MMTVAYNGASSPRAALEEEIRAVAAAGFQGIELRMPRLRAVDLGRLREDIGRAGLRPVAIDGVEGWGEADFSLDRAEEVLQAAARVGADAAVVVPGHLPVFDAAVERRAREQLARLADRAAAIGVRLLVEFLAFPDRGVTSLARAGALIERVGAAHVGLVLDTYHAAMSGLDEAILRAWIGSIRLVHLSDSLTGPDQPLSDDTRVFPGEGHLEVRSYVNFLKEHGFGGPWSVEAFWPGYFDLPVGEVAARAHAAAIALLG